MAWLRTQNKRHILAVMLDIKADGHLLTTEIPEGSFKMMLHAFSMPKSCSFPDRIDEGDHSSFPLASQEAFPCCHLNAYLKIFLQS